MMSDLIDRMAEYMRVDPADRWVSVIALLAVVVSLASLALSLARPWWARRRRAAAMRAVEAEWKQEIAARPAPAVFAIPPPSVSGVLTVKDCTPEQAAAVAARFIAEMDSTTARLPRVDRLPMPTAAEMARRRRARRRGSW